MVGGCRWAVLSKDGRSTAYATSYDDDDDRNLEYELTSQYT